MGNKKILNNNETTSSVLPWFFLFVCILIITCYISEDWYQVVLIRGKSMEPQYHNFQLAILDKHVNTYQSGDVIVFKSDKLNSVLIKRIIAEPNDTIGIKNHILFVNGKQTAYYGDTHFEYVGILKNEIYLEDDSYFVIGDNIAESKDSRYEDVGIVTRDMILGKLLE